MIRKAVDMTEAGTFEVTINVDVGAALVSSELEMIVEVTAEEVVNAGTMAVSVTFTGAA